ncbi:hypothetical protein K435DRAFT_836782 [Dendrothele bispora CBS 962.96]|uniref:Uncharacterized protein n=1 Tax=Dendrothele bispora (strain CBS 962.96) TaxID=1314807 RepID=A0A4S8MFW5_DENBC|nr:hypothetical protein K435DRAFT_836782 [Dendrothele bispora CBS 962.96]
MFSCDLDPPDFKLQFQLRSAPGMYSQCVQLGYSVITPGGDQKRDSVRSGGTRVSPGNFYDNSTNFSIQTISSSNAHFFKSSILHRFSVFPVTAFSSKFSFPTSNSRPGDHDTTTGLTMSPLTSRKVDESSKMHSRVVIIGSQPAIYLAQVNLNSVLYEGFMGNGFAAGGRRTATVNVQNFPGLPTGILGPELMDKFHEQSLRLGTRIITETIPKISLSHCPFRYWHES